jgi:hypothetical protein
MTFYPSYEIETAQDLLQQMTAIRKEYDGLFVEMQTAITKGEYENWLSWNAHKMMEMATYDKCAADVLAAYPDDEAAIQWRMTFIEIGRYGINRDGIETPQSVKDWLHIIYHDASKFRGPSNLSSRSTSLSANFMEDCKVKFYDTLRKAYDIDVVANYAVKYKEKRDEQMAKWKAEADENRAKMAAQAAAEEARKKEIRRQRRADRKLRQNYPEINAPKVAPENWIVE